MRTTWEHEELEILKFIKIIIPHIWPNMIKYYPIRPNLKPNWPFNIQKLCNQICCIGNDRFPLRIFILSRNSSKLTDPIVHSTSSKGLPKGPFLQPSLTIYLVSGWGTKSRKNQLSIFPIIGCNTYQTSPAPDLWMWYSVILETRSIEGKAKTKSMHYA